MARRCSSSRAAKSWPLHQAHGNKRPNIPANAHPLTKQLFELLQRHFDQTGEGVREVADKTGVAAGTIFHWATEARCHNPSLGNLQAVLNYLGHELYVRETSSNEKPQLDR